MHGYFVGKLNFAWVCHNYRPPELISRKIWRSATYTFFGRDPCELLLTKTGESYKIVTPRFTLPALIVVFKSMYRIHGYCVGRLNFAWGMLQLSTTWIDQIAKYGDLLHTLFSVVILGELLLTKSGESYKIITSRLYLPALIVLFKCMYRMHGYCVGRLNFCMSMSKLSTTWIDQSQNMRSATYNF